MLSGKSDDVTTSGKRFGAEKEEALNLAALVSPRHDSGTYLVGRILWLFDAGWVRQTAGPT
jgi:hypothetical protein